MLKTSQEETNETKSLNRKKQRKEIEWQQQL